MNKPATLITGTIATAALGALVLTAAAPDAWAYWSAGGTGSGTAKANTLGTPTVTAGALLGITTFRVANAPAGAPPAAYTVTQGTNPVCTINGATGQCTQLLGLYLGKVSFTITAVRGNWTSPTPTTCTFTLLKSVASLLFGTATCAPASGPPPVTVQSQSAPITAPAPDPTPAPTATPAPTGAPTPTAPATPDPVTTPAPPTPDPTPTAAPDPAPTASPTAAPTTAPDPAPPTTPSPAATAPPSPTAAP